jgi:hypothetical protein
VSFTDVAPLWREGERRLAATEGRQRQMLERVVEAIVAELRRRLGGPFTTSELAALYLRDGTDWCFDVATKAAPGDPEAWDLSIVAGAAFARYVRQASDYGGGRRIINDDGPPTPPRADWN